MSKRVRMLLWVMALLLPLQGLAAVALRASLPVGTPLTAAQPEQAQHSPCPGHGPQAALPALAAPAEHPAAAAPDNLPHHTGHGTLKCCSVLGTLAVMEAPTGLTLATARFAAPRPPLSRPDLGVVPAGIDRPPRG